MIIVIQIAIDTSEFQRETPDLKVIRTEMNEFCHKLERFGYVQCQLCKDGEIVHPIEEI